MLWRLLGRNPTAQNPPSAQQFWARKENYGEDWSRRAELAASFISPRSSVLDVGCGQMQLRQYLPPGCTYLPADLNKWSADVHQVDLSKGEFPSGNYDYAVMLGVIEYLDEPGLALVRARAACRDLIVSYCHPRRKILLRRSKRWEWRNSYSEVDFRQLLNGAGWRIDRHALYEKQRSMLQQVYACVHSD